MSETWRQKKYYPKRVLIETGRVLEPVLPSTIVCLDGGQVEMLRNLTQYLHRRSSFASAYHGSYYDAPSEEEWSQLEAVVAELEEVLMGCDIDALVTAIEAQTDVLDVMRQCVCQISAWQEKQSAAMPDMQGYVDIGDVTYEAPANALADYTPPSTDPQRCEYAQAIYFWVYELYTEKLLPFANSTADAIVSILVASTAFSAFAAWIGIPIAILSGIALAVVAWGVDGSISNFINWLWGKRDEIVCVLYNNLPNLGAAAGAMKSFIDGDSELSFLDKQVLKSVLCSSWHYSWIIKDQQTNGTWDDYLVPGLCDDCEEPVPGCANIGACVLEDWTNGTVECGAGGANIKGGLAYWNKQTFTPGSAQYLVMYWIPREATYPEGSMSFGLKRVSDGQQFTLKTTTTKPVDVLTVDYVSIPSALWGVPCWVTVKQESQWCEPKTVCLWDSPPT